ncbi:MAG TPA: hypothetical protein VLA82_13565 [Actinomycetota bacterium]|nr:hypothetical protein [Actinomycetota bacterium]
MDDVNRGPYDRSDLWNEALWGAGLIGTVIAVVAVIAALGG